MGPSNQTSEEFFDVFLSYRHRDAEKIDSLQEKIEALGFRCFRDLKIAQFADPSRVDRAKVEDLRRVLAHATCLIFAFSRETAERDAKAGSSVGVWMPWELGFFDGSISARIGVYLLDGKPEKFDPQEYFKGSAYLQVYETLSDDVELKAFLDQYAVRERRVDNVASAFVWWEHLFEETLANPVNVGFGVTEWYADYAARFWDDRSVQPLGKLFREVKRWLDQSRITWVRQLRSPVIDAMLRKAHAQRQTASNAVATLASAIAETTGASGITGRTRPKGPIPVQVGPSRAARVIRDRPPLFPALRASEAL